MPTLPRPVTCRYTDTERVTLSVLQALIGTSFYDGRDGLVHVIHGCTQVWVFLACDLEAYRSAPSHPTDKAVTCLRCLSR